MGFKCGLCGRLISRFEYEKFNLCKNCLNDIPKFREAKNKARIRVIKNLLSPHNSIIKNDEDGKALFICNLPIMSVIDNQSDENFSFRIVVKGDLFQREGNLVGLSGFLFDTNFYWATTPENMIKAWDWFNQAVGWNNDYWYNICLDIIRDFFDNNWNVVENEIKDSSIVDILSLIWYLYNLYLLGVDTSSKISEIKMQSKGRARKFEKLVAKTEFKYDYRFSRKAMKEISDIRETLAHLAYEIKLALLAKCYGFNVELSAHPDVIINGKLVEVKKPVERYIPPQGHGLTFIYRESAIIESLSNSVDEGFRQNADVVAISVNHLDDRPIKGYKTNWQKEEKLRNALTHALCYATKDVILLFKQTNDGYFGRIVRCKKKRQSVNRV